MYGLYYKYSCLTNGSFVSDLKRLPVYHQELTTENYLYQDGITGMSQFTLCFWIKRSSLTVPDNNYIVSLAHSGQYLLIDLLSSLVRFCMCTKMILLFTYRVMWFGLYQLNLYQLQEQIFSITCGKMLEKVVSLILFQLARVVIYVTMYYFRAQLIFYHFVIAQKQSALVLAAYSMFHKITLTSCNE